MEESSGSQSSSRQSRQKSKRASRLSITASSWLRATSRGSTLIADLCDPPFYLRLCPLLTCPLKANCKFRGRFTFFPHNFFANLLSSRLSVRISRSFRVIFFLFSFLFFSFFFFQRSAIVYIRPKAKFIFPTNFLTANFLTRVRESHEYSDYSDIYSKFQAD